MLHLKAFEAAVEVHFQNNEPFRRKWRTIESFSLRHAVTKVARETFADRSVRARRPHQIKVFVQRLEES
jgi:hypothetical protein